MAQVKLLKIDTDGVNVEFASADEITLTSYTVTGGGPVLDTDLDMNNGALEDVGDLAFTDPATDGISGLTDGLMIADDIMGEDRDNTMQAASSILFPAVTDVAANLDMLQVPQSSAIPTATPANNSNAGFLVEFDGSLYMWDGSAWNDLGIADNANGVVNAYVADEALADRDFLYISAADNVSKCDASAGGAASRGMGFATSSAIDTGAVNVQSEGVLDGFTLTAGSRYYADPGTAGLITATKPVGSGNTIVQVGYAKSTTDLHIHIEQLGRLG